MDKKIKIARNNKILFYICVRFAVLFTAVAIFLLLVTNDGSTIIPAIVAFGVVAILLSFALFDAFRGPNVEIFYDPNKEELLIRKWKKVSASIKDPLFYSDETCYLVPLKDILTVSGNDMPGYRTILTIEFKSNKLKNKIIIKGISRAEKTAYKILDLQHSVVTENIDIVDLDEVNATIAPRDFPIFKYFKDPIKAKAFEKYDEECPVCGLVTGYSYVNNLYSESKDTDNICPWCIHDGSAAKKYDGKFTSPETTDGILDECVDELIHRTPEMCTWQDIQWPVHCNDYYQFIDYVSWEDIKGMGIEKEIEEDLKNRKSSIPIETIKKNISTGGIW